MLFLKDIITEEPYPRSLCSISLWAMLLAAVAGEVLAQTVVGGSWSLVWVGSAGTGEPHSGQTNQRVPGWDVLYVG